MATTLKYGKATKCELDSAEAFHLGPPRHESLSEEEIVRQVCAQLEQPLDFPPLSQATIPGDRVVLAIGQQIPQQQFVLRGALQALRQAGVEDELTTVLLANRSVEFDRLQTLLAEWGHGRCQLKVHDPDNEKERAMLGVTRDGDPLRLNRELCDADFVLPIGVTTVDPCRLTSWPCLAQLFPVFSDRETIDRLSVVAAEHFPAVAQEYSVEVEDCGRQLGVGLAVQVVPNSEGQVFDILAGEPSSVDRLGKEKYSQTWTYETPVRGKLVIATLRGDADQQTWQNLGRAVAAASTIVEPGGAIAICSELEEPIGRALGLLSGTEDYQIVEREILRSPSEDCGPALQICRALQQGPLYLRSRLRPAVVEGLGVSPLESDNELERLAQSFQPCIILEEAQRSLPGVTEAED